MLKLFFNFLYLIIAKRNILGLVLTYYVNYGLSTRKTAALLKDVYGVNISNLTVLNYVNSVSLLVKPFINNYD